MSAALVAARLGREPQDMLEAAVVLEAWAGVPPAQALAAGRALMPSGPQAPRASTARLPDAAPRRSVSLEAGAFAVSVLAAALWGAPLRADVGADGLRLALTVALPCALALQWTLSSRYLSSPGGLAAIGHRRARLIAGAALVVAAPAAALGAAGLVAGLLTVVWTGGAILARRGRGLAYAAAVAAARPLLLAGLPATPTLAVLAGVIVLAAVAVRRPDAPGSAGPWGRAVRAGLIGGALGLLLIGDRSVSWNSRPSEALLLLPSMLAGAWGGAHLRLAAELPRSLAGTRLHFRARSAPLRMVWGALLRVALACAALSVIAASATAATGATSSQAGELTGFGLLAIVTLLASLLESFGRAGLALAGVLAGLAVEVVTPTSFDGGALVAGSAVAAIVLLVAVLLALRRPATLLATRLWIT